MGIKYKILYIDDEEVNLRIFKNTFRRDFDVVTLQSAKEALEVFNKEEFDIIITDQRMPEMTGVEFLSIIQKLHPSIPPNRLIISGFAQNEDIDQAFNSYNLYSFVSKPWKADELKTLILKAIEDGRG